MNQGLNSTTRHRCCSSDGSELVYHVRGNGIKTHPSQAFLKHFYVSRKGSGGSSPPQVLYENLKSLGSGRELILLEEIKHYSDFYKSINGGSQSEFLKQLNFDMYGQSLKKMLQIEGIFSLQSNY